MIKYLFYAMIWGVMAGYFYIVNITKIPHDLLKNSIITCYFLYFKASYDNKSKYIKLGLQPIFKCLNLKINTYGYLKNDLPTLYIANHSSYLDSLILKYLKPNVKTIAKSNVIDDFSIFKSFGKKILDNWGVIYYERGNKKSGYNVRNIIKETILNGTSVLVYPEGTSHTINGLKKFYPGSFEVAYENNFFVQPITIKYETDITWGEETEFSQKHHIDMLENAIKCKSIDVNNVNITFHPILISSKFENASHLSNYARFLITEEWIDDHHYKKKLNFKNYNNYPVNEL